MYQRALHVLTIAAVILSHPQTTSAQSLTSITLLTGRTFGIIQLGISPANRTDLSGCWWRHAASKLPSPSAYSPFALRTGYSGGHLCTRRHQFWSTPTIVYHWHPRPLIGHGLVPPLGWYHGHRPLYRADYWDHHLRRHPIRSLSSRRFSSRLRFYRLSPRTYPLQSHRAADERRRDSLSYSESHRRGVKPTPDRGTRRARRVPYHHSVSTSLSTTTVRRQANGVRGQDRRRTGTSLSVTTQQRSNNYHRSRGLTRPVTAAPSAQRTSQPQSFARERNRLARPNERRIYHASTRTRAAPSLRLLQGIRAHIQIPSAGRRNRSAHPRVYPQADRGSVTPNVRSSRTLMSSPRVQPERAWHPSSSPEPARSGVARTPTDLRSSNHLGRTRPAGSRPTRSRRK